MAITINPSVFTPDIPKHLLKATVFDCIFNNTDSNFDSYENFTDAEYQAALKEHKKVCDERAKYLLSNQAQSVETQLTNEKITMKNLDKELQKSTTQSNLLDAVLDMITELDNNTKQLLKAVSALSGKQLSPIELQLVLESLPLGGE